jgi:hypothetical protein
VTAAKGEVRTSVEYFRHTLAFVLKPAPGHHSGTYFTDTTKMIEDYCRYHEGVQRTYGRYVNEEGTWVSRLRDASKSLLCYINIWIILGEHFYPIDNL